MSIETVTSGMKNIVEDDSVTNLESTLREYLYARAQEGTIYDYWLSNRYGNINAMIKEHSMADFQTIQVRAA